MSRKLFSLITCLVLVLNFGVVPGAAQAEEGGTITGWVRDADGNQIEGIHVSACDYDDDSVCWWTETSPVDGSYVISGLPTGDYRVHAYSVVGGYWIGEFYDDIPDWKWEQAAPVSVTEGSETLDINFELTLGSAISGVVETATGESFANLWVQACPFDDPIFECTDGHWAMTASDGSYTFVPIPAGSYRVLVEPDGEWKREYYYDTPYWDQATPVVVNAGETQSGIDLILEPGGTISGWVRDANGNPIPNIHIAACDYYDDNRCWWSFAQSPVDGSYSILGLSTGTYRLHAYQNPPGLWLDEFYNDIPGWKWEQATPVAVTEGSETLDINFELTLGGTITGWVRNADGNPIEGIHVSACDYDDDSVCWASEPSPVDGSYAISGLPTGDYRVHAYSVIGGLWQNEFYFDTPFHHEAWPVTVIIGEDTGGIDFTMEPGGTISGTVYEADGTIPIPYVHVEACDWDDTFCIGADTDENGDYTIMGLFGGDYRVNVWGGQGGWIDEFYFETPFHHEAWPVTVIIGEDTGGIDFTMEPGGSVSGTVYEADGTIPIPNVHVEACDWDDTFCMGAEADEFGNYTIMGLPGGDYRVSVWGGQGDWIDEFYFDTPFHHEATAVHVTPGSDTPNIDFTMEPGGSVSGTVYEADGTTPIPNVHVEACDWDDTFCIGAETDENGNYTIMGLLGGDYRVNVWGGQGGWFDEFFNNQHDYEDADPVLVTVGSDTGGIDFFMDLAMGYHDYDQGDVPKFACNAGGWAMDPHDPESTVTVRILVDGTKIFELAADGYREDLETAWNEGWGGCPGGTCAFEVSLWDYLTHYESHEILIEAQDLVSGKWHPLGETPKTLTCRTYDIYAYDPLTGATTQIADLRDTDEYNPSWSPNRKLVAHDVVGEGYHNIYITDVKTGVSTPLLGAEGGNDAVWSQNGKWIAFDRAPTGDASIYILPAEGGIATRMRENAVSADWAPNGKRLVFQDTDGSIRTKPVDGGNGGETIITMNGANPVWSPDGNWIAYDDGGDIWKVQVNVKGTVFGEPIQVTSGPFDDQQPTWSADSTTIVYQTGISRDYDLWSVPAAGGEPTWLTGAFEFGDYDPAYVKEGTNIVYASFSPNNQAAREWVAFYSFDPPEGTWVDEGLHTYHFEWEQGLEGGILDDVTFNVSSDAENYLGYVLLRPWYLRVDTPDGCFDIDTIHPDQLTRFLFGWTNYGSYSEVLGLFDSMVNRVVWDGGTSTDFIHHEIIPRSSEVDWYGYICSHSMP